MQNYIININPEPALGSLKRSLFLEQKELPKYLGVTPEDILNMFYYVINGNSALNYRRIGLESCPLTISATKLSLDLDFYAHPYPLDMEYTLKASKGIIGKGSRVRRTINKSIIVPMSDHIDFDYKLDRIISIRWQTLSYNEEGSVIPHPTYEVEEKRIVFSEIIFAVIEVTVVVECDRYPIRIVLALPGHEDDLTEEERRRVPIQSVDGSGSVVIKEPILAEEVSITDVGTGRAIPGLTRPPEGGGGGGGGYNPNLPGRRGKIKADFSSTITGTFIDSDGEEAKVHLNLEIPKCIDDLLDVCIQNQGGSYSFSHKHKYFLGVRVYYSICDGSTLSVQDVVEYR